MSDAVKRLTVRVIPNAHKTQVIGEIDGVLKIRLQAQPVDGQANDALVRLLSSSLKMPRAAVRVTHGHASRKKVVEISGLPDLDAGHVRRLLLAHANRD